jgi:general secretion pathway protein D
MKKTAHHIVRMFAVMALASCASAPPDQDGPDPAAALPAIAAETESSATESSPTSTSEDSVAAERGDTIARGTGVFVQGAGTGQPNGYAAGDGVTLNFEQASLPEFLRVVFESILKENYLIDPSVSGSVTLHTSRPVTQDTVLPIVEAVLEQNGAALIRDEGMFKIVPMGEAAMASGAPAVGRYPSSATASTTCLQRSGRLTWTG